MLTSVLTFLSGAVAPIVGLFTAKEKTKQDVIALDSTKETDTHEEQSDADKGLAAEEVAAQSSTDKSYWHSFVDGLNRLPRPLMAFLVIFIMIYCPYDPERFSVVMVAYNLVPSWLALIIAQVIALFCGGRMLDKWNGSMSVDPAVVTATLKQINDIRGQVKAHDAALKALPPPANVIIDQQVSSLPTAGPLEPAPVFDKQMAATDTPLPDAAILEWNRRRQPAN